MNRKKGRRHFNYNVFCLPWIIMNFVGILLDIAATAYYFNHFVNVWKDLFFLADLMEVKNTEKLQIFFKDFEIQVKVFNSATSSILTMIFLTSKCFLPLLILLTTGLMSIKSIWEVVKENKRLQILYRRNPALGRL